MTEDLNVLRSNGFQGIANQLKRDLENFTGSHTSRTSIEMLSSAMGIPNGISNEKANDG